MVFKRRTPRSWLQFIAEGFWPRGGWARASRYVVHRLRRLPDPAHKISRGIAAGVFTSFTPFFGLHFLMSAVLAWCLRGNILAALLATFVGNPLTFPLIASIATEIGSWMLGTPHMPLQGIWQSFSNASVELWRNGAALFTSDTANWGRLEAFFDVVFLPYLIGGLFPGFVAAFAAYYLSHPLIMAYQKTRIKRQKARAKRRMAKQARLASKLAGADPAE
ncbi:MAG: DUF2062 domain-containing protein [Pseudomonadota bacterium]